MRLIRSEECASGTRAYYFDRPPDFRFVAGQFVEITLADAAPTDPYRTFSIASAPSEPHLMIATRNRGSEFKRALGALPSGSDIQIDGPYGNLRLRDHPEEAHVFIAGGIGITPFRSILIQATAEQLTARLLLFYANGDSEGAAFLSEIANLRQCLPGFSFVPTLTQAVEGWSGEKGRIDAAMLTRHLPSLAAEYYVSGPPSMVEGTTNTLASLGVPSERVMCESFEGY